MVLERDVMRCWRGSRKCPSPRSGHTPRGWLPSLVVWTLGGVSQAESAHLASGKGRPTMLRVWACVGGLPPPCTVGAKESRAWDGRGG